MTAMPCGTVKVPKQSKAGARSGVGRLKNNARPVPKVKRPK